MTCCVVQEGEKKICKIGLPPPPLALPFSSPLEMVFPHRFAPPSLFMDQNLNFLSSLPLFFFSSLGEQSADLVKKTHSLTRFPRA